MQLSSSDYGHMLHLSQPEELLKLAQCAYREDDFQRCIQRLVECQDSPQWEEPSEQLLTYSPKLYLFIKKCILLMAHAQVKLELYQEAISTCTRLLYIEEDIEALVIMATAKSGL